MPMAPVCKLHHLLAQTLELPLQRLHPGLGLSLATTVPRIP